MKHNLLYVFDNMEFGGGERVFAQIINRLSSKKYKIIVACLPTGAFIKKIEGSGAQIKSVDMRNRFNPGVIWQLSSLIKREGVDIVHSQGARADFFARVAAKLAGAPVVVSTVPMPVKGFDVSPIRKLIYTAFNRFSERFVDRFMVVSDALEKMMIEQHKIDPQRVVKIYNGIEKEEYCISDEEIMLGRLKFRMESGLGEDVPVIGVIGRLVWQKGFEYFIEAIPEVLKKFKEARFLLVGVGELKDVLEAKCKRLKLGDKIIFTGFRNDIKDILASIDVFVMPSLLEGLPMILLETMAMAKPIVATDIDGIKEVLYNGEMGLLVPPKDPKALSGAIVDMLVHRDKAYQMGMAARKIVKGKFEVDIMVQKVEDVYEELLQLRS
ncbi:MAG: glycosyltransferase family 4 protein [Candidatus Scalindua rubra]|uniref:Glycosyltransferase n=1 Tax=Candidatus Scalindua brodae TaxID=237368 RepID=A0A0B0EQK3_9BACT|nr:MAG: glycosyltransferase [Candidatus Scalindua brodae]MBZ0110433.1 glycosyltransferase family 4 protein [Candidatus Scalindua rubra]TWU36267.1 Alpha-D-kanosaminyltransferase [Candidatus Brocadiaceae bacterium S225]